MPPYVKGWPIINQSLDHLSPDLPLLHQKWHRKYGDIYCTKSGATTFVWLSSPQIVKDLIDRRSAIYSSRPPLPLTSDVLSGGRRVAFMPRNNMWRYLFPPTLLIAEHSGVSSIDFSPPQWSKPTLLFKPMKQNNCPMISSPTRRTFINITVDTRLLSC